MRQPDNFQPEVPPIPKRASMWCVLCKKAISFDVARICICVFATLHKYCIFSGMNYQYNIHPQRENIFNEINKTYQFNIALKYTQQEQSTNMRYCNVHELFFSF